MKLRTTDIFKKFYLKNSNLIVLNDKQIKQLQKVIINMADDIIEVLEQIDATYHLTGGSCLGAIRHKGFIPWDDDMDIDIARKDVQKFLEVFKTKYSEKYWIHTPYNKDAYCLPIIQIRLKNTIYKGVNDYLDGECGVPIDIAIMENTYDNSVLRKIHGMGSMFLGLIVSCRKFAQYKDFYLDLAKNLEEETKIFKRKIFIGKVVSFFSLSNWIRIYDKWNQMCKNDSSKYVVVPTGRKNFFGEIYERQKFFVMTDAIFFHRNCKVPKDYVYYLQKMYGDYEKIPSKENIERHALLAFDLNKKN